MKRQSLVLLAVAFVAAGAAGCFKDPVSSLRSGPTIVNLDHTSIYVVTGDSTTVQASVEDNGGNVLPETDAVWTSSDTTIARVDKDTTIVPGNYFTRAFILGKSPTGGITTVTLKTRGLTATVRVMNVPALVPSSQYAAAGAASPDTLIIPFSAGPPPVPPDTVRYSTLDTLVVNGTGFLNFDTSQVGAYATGPTGTSAGFVTSKTASRISVVFTKGASGHVVLKHVQMVTTNPAVGTQPLDSLITKDSLLFSRVRYRGAITQTGDTVNFAFTNGIQPFTTSTVVLFGAADTGIVFDPTHGEVLAPASYAGFVQLQTVGLGVATLDSINSATPATVTAAGFAYPGTVTQAGDTTTVTAAGRVRFDALSRVAVGGKADSIIGFDSLHLFVLAPTGATGALVVSKSNVGVSRIATLTTPVSYTTTTATIPASAITQVGDTLTLTGNAALTVDGSTTIAYGTTTATVLSRGTNTMSVLNGGPSYTGVVTVKLPKVGNARIASLKTGGSYTANEASFLGTVTQVGDTMTITAPSYMTFDAQTSAAFGSAANAAIILSANATTMNVLSPVNYTGPVTVTNALLGTVRVPAMITAASFTINGASFPNANVSVGGGLLGDTITVTAPTGYTFSTAAGKLATVLAGNLAINTSDTTWMLSRSATTLKAFAKRGGGGPVRITNVIIPGGLTVPYLTTPANFPIDSVNADVDLPDVTSQAAAKTITIGASNTASVFGALPGAANVGGESADFWTFTTTAAHKISGQTAWFGSGNPYTTTAPNTTAYTEDIDMLICNSTTKCDESAADLLSFAAATTNQPEKGTTSSALPADTYWVGVLGFNVDFTIVYQLTITLQ